MHSRLLRHFLAVVERRNITAAADDLHISQPALTRSIRQLEKTIGVPLFERLPTGAPSVRLHGRAARRAEQLGMERIAVSISHESEYAVAIAFGIRTTGGRFLFPPDIEERLDDRERRILARMERLRALATAGEPDV